MARTAHEIMSTELFSIRGSETAGDVLRYLLALDISSAPVIDGHGRPVGFVSLRDVTRVEPERAASTFMSRPVDTIATTATLEQVADRMCDNSRHHLVCVDETGRAVGFVSLLDLVRGLRGRPVAHPPAFAPYDRRTGLVWSGPLRFDLDGLAEVGHGPGVYTLTMVMPGEDDRVVWSEACADLHQRLEEILAVPGMAPPHIVSEIEDGALQLRYASAPSLKGLRDALRSELAQ